MPAKPWTPRRIFFSVLTLVSLLFLGSTAYTLWRLHAETMNRIAASSDLYAQVFATQLAHTFNAVRLTLEQLDPHATDSSLHRRKQRLRMRIRKRRPHSRLTISAHTASAILRSTTGASARNAMTGSGICGAMRELPK